MLSVSLSEPHGSRLYVDVADVACAIREAGYGIEQSGAYDVTDLEIGVIVAGPEGLQFGDADAGIAALREVMVEVRADSL